MFNTLKKLFIGEKNMFTIQQAAPSGRFFITDRNGNIAGNSNGYSRKRDATRGAARNGLQIAA